MSPLVIAIYSLKIPGDTSSILPCTIWTGAFASFTVILCVAMPCLSQSINWPPVPGVLSTDAGCSGSSGSGTGTGLYIVAGGGTTTVFCGSGRITGGGVSSTWSAGSGGIGTLAWFSSSGAWLAAKHLQHTVDIHHHLGGLALCANAVNPFSDL